MPTDTAFASAFAIGLGTIGPALAIGIVGAAAMLSIARNPDVSDKIQTNMIIVIAFAEAISIYALITALILKFVQ